MFHIVNYCGSCYVSAVIFFKQMYICWVKYSLWKLVLVKQCRSRTVPFIPWQQFMTGFINSSHDGWTFFAAYWRNLLMQTMCTYSFSHSSKLGSDQVVGEFAWTNDSTRPCWLAAENSYPVDSATTSCFSDIKTSTATFKEPSAWTSI